MIQSMTGYGSAEIQCDDFNARVEIKTLNSKFLDAQIKLPKELNDKELELKSLLESSFRRGKVSFLLELEPKSLEHLPVEINRALFTKYFQEFKSLALEMGAENEDIFKLAIYSPNVIVTKEDLGLTGQWDIILQVIREAIDKCLQFRQDEGTTLEKHFREYLSQIQQCLDKVGSRDPNRNLNIKSRLKKSLSEISELAQVDENRFEQELIYYLEKIDITEEKVRLKSHLDYFEKILSNGEGQGKKLSFLAQEIGREINTIGSKANDAEIQRAVVDMKEALEKIKEQVLNVV